MHEWQNSINNSVSVKLVKLSYLSVIHGYWTYNFLEVITFEKPMLWIQKIDYYTIKVVDNFFKTQWR